MTQHTEQGKTHALGGQRIRSLRERSGKSQTTVESIAELGEHYLKRIELGQITRPQRDTLTRILDALDADYEDRCEILDAYGYAGATALPDMRAIEWARAQAQPVLDRLNIPGQLLDCALRVHAVNHLLLRSLGLPIEGQEVELLRGQMAIEVLLNPRYDVRRNIANAEEYIRSTLPMLQFELRPYLHEAWCQALIDRLRTSSPEFAQLWRETTRAPRVVGARPLYPLVLKASEPPLRFWTIAEPFLRDTRFRLLYYIPADEPTMRQCNQWKGRGA
ncbi:helix-turn-helix domain-containing protein [Candidatus Gracilibacteria bacterium]|nr:helix-turn-helix domain-containing protein [Candidatus Gracilibacteria bacterium]